MSTLLIKKLLSIVNEYKDGKLSQSETLNKLENEYTSAISENKKNITEIMEKHAYYHFIAGGRDALIKLYDNSMNYTSETERKEYDIIFKRIVGEYLVTQLGLLPDYELEKINQEELDIASVDIYNERAEIANLCQEARIIKMNYDKILTEIMNIQHQKDEIKTEKSSVFSSQQISEQVKNPKWINEQIMRTLELLYTEKHLTKKKKEDDDIEYRKATTIRKLQLALKTNKEMGQIELPEVKDIDNFIRKYIRNEVGKQLNNAIRVHNNRTKTNKNK